MHLLKQVASRAGQAEGFPTQVHAITVDHQLQASSEKHATQCAALAQRLAVPHSITRIDWGIPPFPVKPNSGMAVETPARDCRYFLLFDAMSQLGLSHLALGHHLNDQIETMIMRYSRGTRGSGLAGMKRYRRWGMGSSGPSDLLRWYGLTGMGRWILRPLLTIPKVCA